MNYVCKTNPELLDKVIKNIDQIADILEEVYDTYGDKWGTICVYDRSEKEDIADEDFKKLYISKNKIHDLFEECWTLFKEDKNAIIKVLLADLLKIEDETRLLFMDLIDGYSSYTDSRGWLQEIQTLFKTIRDN